MSSFLEEVAMLNTLEIEKPGDHISVGRNIPRHLNIRLGGVSELYIEPICIEFTVHWVHGLD